MAGHVVRCQDENAGLSVMAADFRGCSPHDSDKPDWTRIPAKRQQTPPSHARSRFDSGGG